MVEEKSEGLIVEFFSIDWIRVIGKNTNLKRIGESCVLRCCLAQGYNKVDLVDG